MNIIKPTYGYFLIWGHGLVYRDNILDILRKTKAINVLWIQNHYPSNIKKFINTIYSYNYVPVSHLREKTKYLLHVPPEIIFIFFKNNNPDERFIGEGQYVHTECVKIKNLKEKIRNMYNPREDNERTEHHIIHASDNEIQVEHVLKYLGYKGIEFLKNRPNRNIELNPFLSVFSSFSIRLVNSAQLYCNILQGTMKDFRLKKVRINQTPHYACLLGNTDLYNQYRKRFLGGPLQCDYSIDKFHILSKNMRYLRHPYATSYIVTEEFETNKYLIIDGLHRASILLFNNNKSFPVLVT